MSHASRSTVGGERWRHDEQILRPRPRDVAEPILLPAENLLLVLGDALHTAHFSIGSGTKLALEDAIALAQAFKDEGEAASALPAFERARKPVVDRLQDAAQASLIWFEQMADHMHLSPLPFAYEAMTRSGRIDREKLRKRDPVFIDAYEPSV